MKLSVFFGLVFVLSTSVVQASRFEHAILKVLHHLEGKPHEHYHHRHTHHTPPQQAELEYDTFAVAPKVQTTSGLLTGAALMDSHAFFSIPYAQPPVGDKRFTRPLPLDSSSSSNELDVSTKQQIECYQLIDYTPFFDDYTEDCLVLNVHVPKHLNLTDPEVPPSGHDLPVIIYFHGGGFMTGTGNHPVLDGRNLSSLTNTVVVTANYRLGAFGFITYEEESGELVKGNQGFKDQQLALKWIQNNIGSFGGDKTKVTVAGQSAGAQSAMFHLMSSESKSLFNNAILMSNPALFKYQSLEESQLITNIFMNVTNCTEGGVACLRQVEPQKLVRASYKLSAYYLATNDVAGIAEPMRVILDGEEFTKDPMLVFRDGGWHEDKQVIIGTVKSEIYMPAYLPIRVPEVLFTGLVEFAFGPEVVDDVVELYTDYVSGSGPNKDYIHALTHAVSDSFFNCPCRAMARFASHTAAAKQVYFYSFDKGPDGENCEDSGVDLCNVAGHSTDNMYLFRTFDAENYTATVGDLSVADQLSYYYANFAASGNPSAAYVTTLGDFPEWPVYSDMPQSSARENAQNLVNRMVDSLAADPWTNIKFDHPGPAMDSDHLREVCDYWDSTGAYVEMTPPVDSTTEVTSPEVNTSEVTSPEVNTSGVTSPDYVTTRSTSTVDTTVSSTLGNVETTTTTGKGTSIAGSPFIAFSLSLLSLLFAHRLLGS